MVKLLGSRCAARSFGPANRMLTTFVSTMVAIHCNISSPSMWPRDYGEVALNSGLGTYDFIVIGSGSAGSVVAGRLAENPHNKVLLIEAGGDPPIESEVAGTLWHSLDSDIDWQYSIFPNRKSCLGQEYETCTLTKGKLLGGTHAIDSMIYLHGLPRDYDEWEQQGNPSWSWDNILYYLKKTENFKGDNPHGERGTHGPMNIEPFKAPRLDQYVLLKAARELGYKRVEDFIGGDYVGFGRVYGTLQDGRRMTTAKTFLTTTRRNLHVIKHAVATKILFNEDKHADRVQFVYKGRHDLTARASKEIIISAGAIETPKLLMLSGIGPKAHLEALGIPIVKNLPVGDNLHSYVRVDFFLKLNYENSVGADLNFMDTFYNQWVHRRGPLSTGVLDIVGFIDTEGGELYPDMEIMFSPVYNISDFAKNYKHYISDSLVSQVDPSDRVLVVHLILLRPKSRGIVRLQSISYYDRPLVYMNYLHENEDMERMANGVERILDLENTETLRTYDGRLLKIKLPECDVYGYKSKEYWRCYIMYMSDSGFRSVGTAKMGPKEDSGSVVNSELKVRGVKGLRVIDSSIIPKAITAFTNAATVMVAEKGSSLLKDDWEY